MRHKNFAVFVISHGRAKTLTTPDILRKHGYTGLIYIVVDDTDEQVEQYQERFGENVLVFCKSEYMKSSDSLDTKNITKTDLYARNATIDFARQIRVDVYVMSDDDVTNIAHRFEDNGKLRQKPVGDMDAVFDAMIDFYRSSNHIATLGLGSQRHYIAGLNNQMFQKGISENLQQFFMLSTDKDIRFRGAYECDIVTHFDQNRIGNKCFVSTRIEVTTPARGSNAGGISTAYTDIGGADSKEMFCYRMVTNPYVIPFFHNGKFRRKEMYITPAILNEKYKKTELQ